MSNNFNIDMNTGLISPARFIMSPNYDDRPDIEDISVLVIHAISLPPGEYGGEHVENLFCNKLDSEMHPYFREIAGLEVSSHLYIKRDGQLLQFVPFAKRAWHAGKSSCEGRERVNDFSIGIELEGDDFSPFEDAQYKTLAAVTSALINAYPALDVGHIYGHEDISPGRKTDPGPHFDWQRYRSMCRE